MAGSDDYWRQEFRFSKETFMEIILVVRPYLEKQYTNFRRAIPIEGRLSGDCQLATAIDQLLLRLAAANQLLSKLQEISVK